MSLNDTPRADRLHIGLFGKRNSGKSSLINALTGQDIAIVSDTPGTTADPVFKSMELHPVGPVVFIDTAGFDDDQGELGQLRVKRTEDVVNKTDIGIIVVDGRKCLEAAGGSSCSAGDGNDRPPAADIGSCNASCYCKASDRQESQASGGIYHNAGMAVSGTATAEQGESSVRDPVSGSVSDSCDCEVSAADASAPGTGHLADRTQLSEGVCRYAVTSGTGSTGGRADRPPAADTGSSSESCGCEASGGQQTPAGEGTYIHADVPGTDGNGSGELTAREAASGGSDKSCGCETCSDQSEPSALAQLLAKEQEWAAGLKAKNIPVITVVNKCEDMTEAQLSTLQAGVAEAVRAGEAIAVSAKSALCMDSLRKAIQESVPEDLLRRRILGDMADEGSLVLLVMPQDIQAPKGRLILPQVQTIRELLDGKCTTVCTTADGLGRALGALSRDPDLIITASQCFRTVYDMKPESSRLTSFSVLFAAYKGDIDSFIAGASTLDDMTEKSRVLIAEACTHVPLSEDIGRVKIPNLLRKKFGEGMEIVNVCGNDFPDQEELTGFDLVIHCGACMFNRRHVLSRIAQAQAAGVPITNYGIVLAKLTGILDKIQTPES